MHIGLSPGPRRIKMLAAHGDVAVIPANFGLCAVDYCFSELVHAQVHRRFASAIANAFKLNKTVCYAQQGGGTGKQLALEIRTQAVTHNGNASVIGKARRLPNLFLTQKLRFVD